MKRKKFISKQLLKTLASIFIVLTMWASVLVGCGYSSESQTGGEPVTITWATIAGFYTDWAEMLARNFTERTGVNVNIIQMDLPTMYERQVLDIVGGTATYDIITWNYTWKGEWMSQGFMINLDDYIARDADEIDLDDIPRALLSTNVEWQGSTYGLPYYQFTPGLIYRADLFEHPAEMAAFRQVGGEII